MGRLIEFGSTPKAYRTLADLAARAEACFREALSTQDKDQEAAIELYVQAVSLDPRQAGSFVNLSRLYSLRSEFEKALECADNALRIDPRYALAHFNRGCALEDLGRPGDAIESYKNAVRCDPDFADAHYNLALCYQRRGEHRKTLPHFKLCAKRYGDDMWGRFARAQFEEGRAREKLTICS